MAANNAITCVTGTGVYVRGNDIDTDRIIPAGFLRCVTFDGLGEHAFHGERFTEDGTSREHVVDRPQHRGASILIVDDNFGCGSSREHAPQALMRFGFKAIIGGSFADIFFGNSTTLGVPCVCIGADDRARLAKLVEDAPDTAITVNIEALTVTAGNDAFPITLRSSARQAFHSGRYDPLDQLLEAKEKVAETASMLGYV